MLSLKIIITLTRLSSRHSSITMIFLHKTSINEFTYQRLDNVNNDSLEHQYSAAITMSAVNTFILWPLKRTGRYKEPVT